MISLLAFIRFFNSRLIIQVREEQSKFINEETSMEYIHIFHLKHAIG